MSIKSRNLVEVALGETPFAKKPEGKLDVALMAGLIPEASLDATKTVDKPFLQQLATHMATKVTKLPGTDLNFLHEIFGQITKLLKNFSEERARFDDQIVYEEYMDRLNISAAQYKVELNKAIASDSFEFKIASSHVMEKVITTNIAELGTILLVPKLDEHGRYIIHAYFEPTELPPWGDDDPRCLHEIPLSTEEIAKIETALVKKDPAILKLPTDLKPEDQAKIYARFLILIGNQIDTLEISLNKGSITSNLLNSLGAQIHRVLIDPSQSNIEAFQTNIKEGRFFRAHADIISGENGIHALGIVDIVKNNIFNSKLNESEKLILDIPKAYREFKELIEGLRVDQNFQPFLDEMIKNIENKASDCS